MLPKDIFMVIGGSPCQGFSLAGRRKGMVAKDDLENIEVTSLFQYMNLKESGFQFEGESYLFWEFIRLVKLVKPKYYLLENVKMAKRWEKIISKELGVEPIHINSNLLTAQNRDRYYWTNIPGITQPENTFTHISEVVPEAIGGWGKRGRKYKGDEYYTLVATTRKDGKSNCLTKSACGRFVELNDGRVIPLTIDHCEMLQGVPVGYTETIGVCKTDRHKMLGNGWTVPVIEHIFSFVPEFELVKV
jgi:DNA (cytosine-5)-methyltransferase 3A